MELKNILPPREIQNAMEKQMKAERERRESILQAEGEKASKILVAEGEKQSTILRADAAKQAKIMAAEAEARAKYFCGVHAAKNGFQFIRGLRAASSVRRFCRQPLRGG